MELESKQRKKIIQKAEKVFFDAMLDGYAGNKKNSVKVIESSGYKRITFVSGNYKVVDHYCVTPLSDFSAGTTTIFYRFRPRGRWMAVWWMSYSGCYPKEVISFLKMALNYAYKQREFHGGRGLATHGFYNDTRVGNYDKNLLKYENTIFLGGGFENFAGMEHIFFTATSGEIGFHEYNGRILI
ncbi:MAG: hypothetical protein JW740_00565 [Candidatus Zambryskibacteria bacterium]|nr:hypothetical protein [Candidatus Zambryskibacteria bacterium]